MHKDLLNIILCPVCGGGDWRLDGAETATLDYEEGPVEEVRNGELHCGGCERVYPISEYVLSFAQLFPDDLRREAAFWDRFYVWNIEHGSMGFYDLRKGFTPFMAFGVPDPFPAADLIDRYDVHFTVAEHPILRRGTSLLDIGVGLGWTSLHFARAGYKVTAFDPSLGPMQAAKRYAVEQRRRIEYICAAMGHIAFRPASFDNAAAFHSLHHVPDLEGQLRLLSEWVAPGGGFAVDEHICNSRLAHALAAQLHHWAVANVFPTFKTISDEELATLPSEPHSEREDASADLIVPLLNRFFTVHLDKRRHVFFDHYPLLYYLWQGRDLDAYRHALAISNTFQELVLKADPDGAEYVTFVAENTPPLPEAATPLPPAEAEAPPDPLAELQAEVESLRARLSAAEALEGLLAEAGAQREQLRAQVDSATQLQQAHAEQTAWARQLEQNQLAKQREIDALRKQLRRIENGKLMRVLRLVDRVRGR